MRDREDEYKQERLFQRVARIHISIIPSELSEIDFVEGGGRGDFYPHTRYISHV